jgi:hypothetical protein
MNKNFKNAVYGVVLVALIAQVGGCYHDRDRRRQPREQRYEHIEHRGEESGHLNINYSQ